VQEIKGGVEFSSALGVRFQGKESSKIFLVKTGIVGVSSNGRVLQELD